MSDLGKYLAALLSDEPNSCDDVYTHRFVAPGPHPKVTLKCEDGDIKNVSITKVTYGKQGSITIDIEKEGKY